jgi:hypothetical protein
MPKLPTVPSAAQLMPSWRVICREISAIRTRRLTICAPATVVRLSIFCLSVAKLFSALLTRSACTAVATVPVATSADGVASTLT